MKFSHFTFLFTIRAAIATVTCLNIDYNATAHWTNAKGQYCTWTGLVGNNFGINAVNKGEYSCNGRCGAGCTGASLGNVYTQQCWDHDICSWFNNASGGARDPNCGAAFNAAQEGFVLGELRGCDRTNPMREAIKPVEEPRCG